MDRFEVLTGKIEQEGPAPRQSIGDRIRIIREQKGLTHKELSSLTGFDVELLEKIETGEVQPQLGVLARLSKALESAFSRLVSGDGDRLFAVTRKDEGKPVIRTTSATGKKVAYTYKSLAPEVKGRHMEPLIVDLEPAAEKDLSVHEGEEFIYVVSGEVVAHIGEETYVLAPGDSIYYLSTTPHMIAAKGEGARILAVIYEE